MGLLLYQALTLEWDLAPQLSQFRICIETVIEAEGGYIE